MCCYLFISTYIYYPDGKRAILPSGQFIYFFSSLLVLMFLLYDLNIKSFGGETKKYIAVVFLFFIFLLISALLGTGPYYGTRLLVILFLTSFPYILIAATIVNSSIKYFVLPLALFGLMAGLAGWYLQTVGGLSVAGWGFKNYLHYPYRWSFLFEEANGFAAMLVISVLSLIYLIAELEKRSVQILLVIGLIFLIITFLKTNSRASLLWLIWGLFLYSMYYLNVLYKILNKPRFYWILILATSIVTLVFIVNYNFKAIYQYLRLEQDDLTTGRLSLWLIYISKAMENPIFGFGFGATGELLREYHMHSPLNVFIGILGESGLLAFMMFIYLWGMGVYKVVKYILVYKDSNLSNMNMGIWVLSLLGGIALQQNFEWGVLRISPINYLFFFLLSLAWVLPRNHKYEKMG